MVQALTLLKDFENWVLGGSSPVSRDKWWGGNDPTIFERAQSVADSHRSSGSKRKFLAQLSRTARDGAFDYRWDSTRPVTTPVTTSTRDRTHRRLETIHHIPPAGLTSSRWYSRSTKPVNVRSGTTITVELVGGYPSFRLFSESPVAKSGETHTPRFVCSLWNGSPQFTLRNKPPVHK